MSFHSLDYLLFLPVVVGAYFGMPHRWRWLLLLAASNLFYASWRVEFLWLLWFTTLVDYGVARLMARTERRSARNLLMAVSLCANLGLLIFFKYFLTLGGAELLDARLNWDVGALVLPLGISFYTFQTLGYTIDVYRGRRRPERHLGHFAVYVMYFPQLIAGPIERPGRLLPQLHERKRFDPRLVAAGGALMLVGYFKKLVVADRLANFVVPVMSLPDDHSPLVATLAAMGSIYRYYADLSGYADIAIGSSLMLGIRLSQNFNRPFAAVSISEFWQRWHITVTTWFRDYLYMPIARRAGGPWRKVVATVATVTIIGLWHGAAWTWLAAGLVAGLIMIAEGAARRNHRLAATFRAGLVRFGLGDRSVSLLQDGSNRAVLWVFLVLLGALVNAPGMAEAMTLWLRIGQLPFDPLLRADELGLVRSILLLAAAVAVLEGYHWLDARQPVFERLRARGAVVSWTFYYLLAAAILVFGSFARPDFIYFRF